MHNKHLEKLLFLDIETVAENASLDQLSERKQELWRKKSTFIQKSEDQTAESLYEKAGIYAEFGKIVCIAVGYFHLLEETAELRIKAFSSTNEVELLQEFCTLLNQHYDTDETIMCAHNGKEFDFPYIARRLLINRIKLPKALQLSGKKPWEIKHQDTMELWKFGDYKNFTSLDLLAELFNIESSKSGIDGSMVNEVYYQQGDLERITEYCKRDVAVLAQIYLQLTQDESISDLEIKLL
jgi:uncharacterized protein YprB with RNaseH-like and TPR domain